MIDRSHVTSALETELEAPEPTGVRGPSRAEDLAFAACATALLGGMNAAMPAGGILAAVIVADVARRRHAMERPLVPDVSHAVNAADEVLASQTLAGEGPAVEVYQAWMPWSDLKSGEHVLVPSTLPHPVAVGFEYTRLASLCGQCADWVHPLIDGSRLHVHEYPDGKLVLHHDTIDPARGAGPALIHWMSDTAEGNLLAFASIAGLVALGALLVES